MSGRTLEEIESALYLNRGPKGYPSRDEVASALREAHTLGYAQGAEAMREMARRVMEEEARRQSAQHKMARAKRMQALATEIAALPTVPTKEDP